MSTVQAARSQTGSGWRCFFVISGATGVFCLPGLALRGKYPFPFISYCWPEELVFCKTGTKLLPLSLWVSVPHPPRARDAGMQVGCKTCEEQNVSLVSETMFHGGHPMAQEAPGAAARQSGGGHEAEDATRVP